MDMFVVCFGFCLHLEFFFFFFSFPLLSDLEDDFRYRCCITGHLFVVARGFKLNFTIFFL